MFWTGLALISLVVLGGFISYYGDLQGRRWGKKRVSWFGLRPKHTAILITSLTGAFVALLSIVTLLAVAPAIRNVVLRGEQAIQENKTLNSQLITQRLESERALRELETRQTLTQTEFNQLKEQYSRTIQEFNKAQIEQKKLRASSQELQTKYISLQDAQKGLERVLGREKDQVLALRGTQKKLIAENDKTKSQNIEAGKINTDLGRANYDLTRRKAELEKTVAAAEDSLAQLQETNATLAAEGKRLQEQNGSLTRQNVALFETAKRSEEYNNELKRKNDELLFSNSQLRGQQEIYLAGLRGAGETVGAIRQGRVVIRTGGELARRIIPANSRPELVKRELENLLDDAHYTALALKAGIGDNKRAVRIISKRVVSQNGVTMADENASIGALMEELTGQDTPVVVIANALNNSLEKEQAVIEITPIAVKPAFDKGEVVAESIIDTKQPLENVVDSIVRFLSQNVSQAAIKKDVIARIDPDSGTAQVGIAVARDLVTLTEKVRKAGGKVRLQALSAQTMSTADPLLLNFKAKRMDRNAPEIFITPPGERGTN